MRKKKGKLVTPVPGIFDPGSQSTRLNAAKHE